MENGKLPLRIVSMGDVIDEMQAMLPNILHFIKLKVLSSIKNVSFCDLSGILTEMMTGVFGTRVEVRFSSYFPFVEPGAETFISVHFAVAKVAVYVVKQEK